MRSIKMAENNKERFEILLEAIQGDVRAIAEGQGLLGDKVNSLDNKVDQIDNKIEQMDTKIYQLDNKIYQLDKKIDVVHDSLKSEIAATSKVLDYSIKELGEKISRVEQKLDRHIQQPAHA